MRDTADVHGYESNSYGDGFAEVYDDWYADVTDVDATVDRMVTVAGAGRQEAMVPDGLSKRDTRGPASRDPVTKFRNASMRDSIIL